MTLDAGCGTGLSSRALLELSHRVVALDSSAQMLSFVPSHERIHRVLAQCEQLPLTSRSIDLISASCVIHWLDRPVFMAEAARVLKPGGPLVVYDDYFMAEQPAMPEFKTWFEQQYLPRYPTPPRNSIPLDDPERWRAVGFELAGFERFDHYETYSASRFVDYLLTQSNVISAVEDGGEELESVRTWLGASLMPFFSESGERRFRYSGPIAILHAR